MTSLSESTLLASDKQLSHPKYRPDIDGLRAIAVLSVVVFHAFPSLFQGGFVGVDIFFVISGFLISSIIFGSLENNSFSFMKFYTRRINRIFPTLLLVLAVVLIFGWLILLADEYMQLGKHVVGGSTFILNFILLRESGYFDSSTETKILLHLWSLGIEEQFYLIWPLMVWAAWKSKINVLMLIVVTGGLSFALNIMNVQSDATGTFYSPHTRFWELLVGSLLAYVTIFKLPLTQHWSGQPARNILSAIGFALLIAAFSLTTKSNHFPGWWALLPTIGAALIITAGPFSWLNRVVLSNRIFVWVGLISFPLYLWHWPLLAFARILGRVEPTHEIRIALVFASIALAWLTYLLIEKPLRTRGSQTTKAIILSASSVAICALGLAIYSLKGIESRFPDEIRNIANFNYEYKTDARYSKCWLSYVQPFDDYSRECSPTQKRSGKHSIFIWGDSHAGRLYPGLKIVLGSRYEFYQFTRDACPPVPDYSYELCAKSNASILSKIKNTQPETVVLFAVWNKYQKDWASPSEAKTGLLKTIGQLRAIGIQNIVIIGPAPHWPSALPAMVYSDWKSNHWKNGGAIADRIVNDSDAYASSSDEDMSTLLSTQPVRYISLIKYLCSEKGCLTHVPGKPDDLLTWDYGHLTTQGAMLVSKYLNESGVFK